MQKLTIFTPTYNRAHTLPILYNSLQRQTSTDFMWLIVDDGSTDNTRVLCSKWISEGNIEIEYYYQENAGKMAAYDKGVNLCRTELFMNLDSDDYLVETAVDDILNCWEQNKQNKHLCGVVAPRRIVDSLGNEVRNPLFPDIGQYSTLTNIYEHGYIGETNIAFLRNIRIKYKYPIIKGEKFIPEGYVLNQIDEKYELAILNKVVSVCEYRDDGYTRSWDRLLANNPKGAVLWLQITIPHQIRLRNKIGLLAKYIAYSIIAQYNLKHIVLNTQLKFLCIISMPLGLYRYLQLRKYRNINQK